jgi:hypothetical protein
MLLGLIAWTYLGMGYFDVQTPYMAWFDKLAPGDKVEVGVWLGIGILILSDAVFLLRHGLFGGGARAAGRPAVERRSNTDRRKGMR